MNENENSSSEKQSSTHILTLHLSRKGKQKTISLKKNHAIAMCVTAAVFIGGGAFFANSYFDTKNQLLQSEQALQEVQRSQKKLQQNSQALQSENSEYTENIQSLQSKAAELEQKINELETVKEDLNTQLNNINASDSATASVVDAVAGCLTNSETPELTFTTIVSPAYNKVTALSVQLDRMDTLISETEVSFTSVATSVTETLAAYSDIPEGMPVNNGVLTTWFNPNGDAGVSDGRTHKGIDLSTRHQVVPIYTTATGTVVASSYDGAYGNCILIDHGNGFTTLYAHNSENLVSVGDKVKKGDTIGMTGSTGQSTGVHCHYEIQLNGIYQDPLDYQ